MSILYISGTGIIPLITCICAWLGVCNWVLAWSLVSMIGSVLDSWYSGLESHPCRQSPGRTGLGLPRYLSLHVCSDGTSCEQTIETWVCYLYPQTLALLNVGIHIVVVLQDETNSTVWLSAHVAETKLWRISRGSYSEKAPCSWHVSNDTYVYSGGPEGHMYNIANTRPWFSYGHVCTMTRLTHPELVQRPDQL